MGSNIARNPGYRPRFGLISVDRATQERTLTRQTLPLSVELRRSPGLVEAEPSKI